MHRKTVWTERSIPECLDEMGKPPVPVRWVVTDEGDETNPNVRVRLVAKHIIAEYGEKGMYDIFAALPPFRFIKMLIVKSVQRRRANSKIARKVMSIDISKAHLYAKEAKDYVHLPPEGAKPGKRG